MMYLAGNEVKTAGFGSNTALGHKARGDAFWDEGYTEQGIDDAKTRLL